MRQRGVPGGGTSTARVEASWSRCCEEGEGARISASPPGCACQLCGRCERVRREEETWADHGVCSGREAARDSRAEQRVRWKGEAEARNSASGSHSPGSPIPYVSTALRVARA
eukprot:2501976-Rhodomonas_salina.1